MLMLLALIAAERAPAAEAAWEAVVDTYTSSAWCVTEGARARAGESRSPEENGAVAAAACAQDHGRYEEAFAAWHGAEHAGQENAAARRPAKR